MELLVKKKEIVNVFLRNKVLISREILSRLDNPVVVDEWHTALSKGIHPVELLSPPVFSPVKFLLEYDDNPKKRSVQDFVDYFNARYRAIERMLQGRQELQNLTSISRLRGKKERENVSIIGIVRDKRFTKNEHLIMALEDSSCSFNVLFS